MTSVGFITARSRSWNKRSAQWAHKRKTSKNRTFKWSLTNSMRLGAGNRSSSILITIISREYIYTVVLTHWTPSKIILVEPLANAHYLLDHFRKETGNKTKSANASLWMCNVTTPCCIKKTLGAGLGKRQRAHYFPIYHVSDNKINEIT